MSSGLPGDAAPDSFGRPETFAVLHQAITERYEALSPRLRQLGEYALAHPEDMALETIAVIAARAQVPPSSLIRFAKALGYDGFSEMQRVFRQRLLDRTPSYGERLARLRDRLEPDAARSPLLLLDAFASGAMEALDRLRRELPGVRLEAAIDLLARAETIHVAAQRRAFPVAVYVAYLLAQLERRVHLLDNLGGMLEQQGQSIGAGDVLLAVSFRSYAPETLAVVERAQARGVPVLALTDGPLSPLARLATVSLEVVEAEVQAFRSLSASMCLALVLAVALGERLERAGRSES